jgi:hypothetical protein
MNKVQSKSGFKMTFRAFFLFTCSLFFFGCSPKYIVKNEYVPSIKSGFNVCLQECETKRSSCNGAFMAKVQDCKNQASLRAKDIYKLESIEYKKKYISYQESLHRYLDKKRVLERKTQLIRRDYHYFVNKCKETREYYDRYACTRARDLRQTLQYYREQKPYRPLAPEKPIFSKIYENESTLCSLNSQCESLYDKCYLSCGGKIVPHKICIENCD